MSVINIYDRDVPRIARNKRIYTGNYSGTSVVNNNSGGGSTGTGTGTGGNTTIIINLGLDTPYTHPNGPGVTNVKQALDYLFGKLPENNEGFVYILPFTLR